MSIKGQVLPLFAVLMIGLAVLAGLVVDGAILYWKTTTAQEVAASACLAYADHGATSAANLITVSDVPASVITNLQYTEDSTYKVEISWWENTYFLNIVGISRFPIYGKARCIGVRAGILPIVVREDWVEDSFMQGVPYPILGQGAEPIDDAGGGFAGAAYDHIICLDGAPCLTRYFYDPLTEQHAQSCQPTKDIPLGEFEGTISPVYMAIGNWIPTVSGVSNNQLVKAMVRGGWKVGDEIVVAVYDGTVHRGVGGNCDNVNILYYAKAQITMIDANTIEAIFISEPMYSLEEVSQLTHSRLVNWDYEKGD